MPGISRFHNPMMMSTSTTYNANMIANVAVDPMFFFPILILYCFLFLLLCLFVDNTDSVATAYLFAASATVARLGMGYIDESYFAVVYQL